MNLFRAFVVLNFHTAVEGALVAFGFAAAQVRFADLRMHQFAGGGHFEPLGGGFVGFQFGHDILPVLISDL